MTTINLYQNKEEDKISLRSSDKGFMFSMGILLVTVLVFAGLKFYVPFLRSKNLLLEDKIVSENEKLVGFKKMEQVMDMQVRLAEIRSNLQIKNGEVMRVEMNKILDNLAADLAPGVVVSSYSYDAENIKVKFNSSNYNDVAKQVFNFKKSENFSDISVKSIARQESAIVCEIAMKTKNKAN